MMTAFPPIAASLITAVGATAPIALSTAVAERGRVVLPMVDRHGFAMVRGKVNGRRGLFMLDTGTPFPVFLNIDYLRLAPGKEVARGSAASGQGIVVLRQGCVKDLSIAGTYTLESPCGLNGAHLKFVADGVDRRFLGFVGYEVFKPYRVTFDYAARRVVLSDRTRAADPDAITVFRFAAADGRVPNLAVTTGGLGIAARMDTGDEGHVRLTRPDADQLLRSGGLTAMPDAAGGVRYVLASVDHDGRTLNTADLPVTIVDDRSDIMLGFLFLRHYRSVWDYADHSVRLYEARPIVRGHGAG